MQRMFLILVGVVCFAVHPLALAEKPYNELLVSQADLSRYPKNIYKPESGVEVTIGDLHGNALKLLYFLIRNDVVYLSEQDYEAIVQIYKKEPEKLSSGDLSMFRKLIDGASFNTEHKVRLLGDDLSDRGMNDYYTLYIYQKLDMLNVPFEIVLSNHSSLFLEAHERPEKSYSYNPYSKQEHAHLVRSMLNLGKLIDRGLVEKDSIWEVAQTHYLKHIVLPGYTANRLKNEITLYTHAPVDLAILASLANELGTLFDNSSIEAQANSLDSINAQIKAWIMSNTFTKHYNAFKEKHKREETKNPLKQVLWNRDYSVLKREYDPKGLSFTINYVHGHDSSPNVFDLDNLFGKGDGNEIGAYAVHITHAM